ncbi:unnamed protein product, partial [Sphacelaria rigidula]
ILINLDDGTLEPPSPPGLGADSGFWRSGNLAGGDGAGNGGGGGGGKCRRRREKRTITSHYIRCPFLDPVKSKHTYRVPRGGLPTVPSPPIVSANAPDAASIAALMYSSVASAKASKARAAAEAAVVTAAMHGRSDKGHGHRLHVVEMPPSETMLREGRSASRDNKPASEGGIPPPGPGGAGGKLREDASEAAVQGRESWIGHRQRMKGNPSIAGW